MERAAVAAPTAARSRRVAAAGTMIAVRLRQGLPWLVTVALAIAVLALVTGWVLAAGINRGEALKTGGLAAGSVVALYALWLNDRRRRVEEQRQEIERARQELESQRYELEQRRQDLENRRAEHDRGRVADERFARAVELLGNPADQVRVGALHALAGLALNRVDYTQTVLDVLCSYLRGPFDAEMFGEDTNAYRREQQVRRAAQRLIFDLLPHRSDQDAPAYDLDLHGATLEYFDLSERVIGQLRARLTTLVESTNLKNLEVRGSAWFTESRCTGRLWAQGVVFHARSWFSRFEAIGKVDFTGTEFRGDTKFAGSQFGGPVIFKDATFGSAVDFSNTRFRDELDLRVAGGATADTRAMRVSLGHATELPAGWTVDTSQGTELGLVRA